MELLLVDSRTASATLASMVPESIENMVRAMMRSVARVISCASR